MGLINVTQQAYYSQSQGFTGDGSTTTFTLTTTHFPSLPAAKANIQIFVNGKEVNTANYNYSSPTVTFTGNSLNTDVLESNGAPKTGLIIQVKESVPGSTDLVVRPDRKSTHLACKDHRFY